MTTPRVTVPVDYETLSELHTLKGWLHGLANHIDLCDVVADGGVTAGMAYQQEATEFAGRLRRILDGPLSAAPAPEGGAVDDLYERAKVFATRDKPSTSYLQRRLQITFNQASSLIERMESEGLVSKANAAGIRTILVPYDPAIATPAVNVTILITKAQRDAALNSGKKLNDWISGVLHRAVEEAPAEAGEIGAEYDDAAHCVTLAECPPGLFLWNGTLGFKSEYGAMEPDDATNGKHWKVGNRADAYCADSGEYFWGGQPGVSWRCFPPPSGSGTASTT